VMMTMFYDDDNNENGDVNEVNDVDNW
jgi:hypothetical protein